MTQKSFFVLAAAFLFPAVAEAQDFQPITSGPEALREAVLQKLVVWTNPNTGERTYVSHCRNAPGGCEERIEYLVSEIYEACATYDVDPYLAVAVAWHESRFDPSTIGQVGEAGIFQIHPGAPWAQGLAFVRQPWYRHKCLRKIGACQEGIIDTAVKLLNRCLNKCSSTRAALGLYNTGTCDGNRSYSWRVFRVRKDLISRVEYLQEHDIINTEVGRECRYRLYSLPE